MNTDIWASDEVRSLYKNGLVGTGDGALDLNCRLNSCLTAYVKPSSKCKSYNGHVK